MSGNRPSLAPVEMLPNPAESPGLSGENCPHVTLPGPRPAWIPDALLAETVEVWSECYRRRVSEEEAVDILVNVRRLGEAILKAKREMRK